MAEIFLAREPLEGGGDARYVVVKRILEHVSDDEAFVSMFLDEARLAARLRHPHICPVYELGRDGDDWYLAMEWVHGVTLRELQRRLERAGSMMPVAMAVRIASDIAGALHYAHQLKDDSGQPLGIVHRDVSPHNVMISFDGAIKLLDFGIAKAKSHSNLTRTGQLKGKLGYMAPEQCMQLEVDPRTDIFALGILLYECLTGKLLFKADSEIATMRNIMEHTGAPSVRALRPDVPAALDEVLRRALAPKPRERFETAAKMQRALEQVLVSRSEIVHETQLTDFLTPLFKKEIARGPRLKKGRARRRDGASSSASGRSLPSASGVMSASYGTHASNLSEQDLAAIARTADAEAAALAGRHVRKLALLALALLAVVGGVFWLVGREALEGPQLELTEPPQGSVPAAAPRAEPADRARTPEPAPRFRVVVPEADEVSEPGAP